MKQDAINSLANAVVAQNLATDAIFEARQAACQDDVTSRVSLILLSNLHKESVKLLHELSYMESALTCDR